MSIRRRSRDRLAVYLNGRLFDYLLRFASGAVDFQSVHSMLLRPN